MNWVPHKLETWPYRYGETSHDVLAARYTGKWSDTGPITDEYTIPKGTTVKITMVSRLGDVGITDKLDSDSYVARVAIDSLVNLRVLRGK